MAMGKAKGQDGGTIIIAGVRIIFLPRPQPELREGDRSSMRQRLIKEVNKLKVGQRIFAINEDDGDAPRWATVVQLDSAGFVIRWDDTRDTARMALEDIVHFTV